MTTTDRSANRIRRIVIAGLGSLVLVLSQFSGAPAAGAKPLSAAESGNHQPPTAIDSVKAGPTTTTTLPKLAPPLLAPPETGPDIDDGVEAADTPDCSPTHPVPGCDPDSDTPDCSPTHPVPGCDPDTECPPVTAAPLPGCVPECPPIPGGPNVLCPCPLAASTVPLPGSDCPEPCPENDPRCDEPECPADDPRCDEPECPADDPRCDEPECPADDPRCDEPECPADDPRCDEPECPADDPRCDEPGDECSDPDGDCGPDRGSLAFTGAEVWHLVLLGSVLVGIGTAVRAAGRARK